jgi:riboflavin kinase/FMN adenylyltransferase
VRVGWRGQFYDGGASYGRRPMFDTGGVLLEVFLFDFAHDLYGSRIEVAFVAFLRDEERFASVDALVRQMHEDARGARAALARAGNALPPV